MVATIDTLKIAKRFREAKTDEERAEAFAEGLREVHESRVGELVTKAELALAVERLERRIDGIEARLGARIDGVEARLSARIDGVEAPLGARIDGVEAQLGARIDGVEAQLGARIDALGKDLTIRLGWMLAAAVVLVGALVAIF